jgi:hypothetical protein
MIDGKAGGHTFVNGLCDCGRRLVDLRGLALETDLNKPNIAHAGNATVYEINEINALIAKMDAVFTTVLGWK